MRRAVVVFLGGGIGSCVRAVLLQATSGWNSSFPLVVWLINLLGAFGLGVVFVLADEADLMSVEVRLLLAVGVLGGFTTFSTFAWGADVLARDNHPFLALIYVLSTLVGGIVAAAAGVLGGRELVSLLERLAEGVLRRLETGRRRTGVPEQDMALIETDDREESA